MNSQSDTEQHGPKIDWLGLARTHGRFVMTVATAVATIVLVAGFIYLKWGQPTQRVASLEFRPAFSSVQDLQYPNGLPFSPNDVTAGPIIDLVYEANAISAPCDRESFRAGFVVEQRSDQSVFLDLEYQSRLTEPRITMVERKALQEEHAAKRKALPFQYRLVFIAPAACRNVPAAVISKAMVDVLQTWASESEEKRGVLNHQVEVFTPAMLDVNVSGSGGLLLKADLLRTALQRIIQNIDTVGKLPGAVLIRLGPNKLTFAEVKGKLIDLVNSRLDPWVMTSGRSMVRESSLWVIETVAAAKRAQDAAMQMVNGYRQALQEFSGDAGPVGTGRGASSPGGTGSPRPVGQGNEGVDSSFIDRIVQLSEANSHYRQKLTDAMVAAQLDAVKEGQRASYYERLLQMAGRPGPEEELDLEGRLTEIVVEGKRLTAEFGKLYEEFSRVALRSSGALYETRKPVTIETTQQFSRRSLLNLVAIAFIGAALVTFGFRVARSRMKLESR
jgi:hypothetical protein